VGFGNNTLAFTEVTSMRAPIPIKPQPFDNNVNLETSGNSSGDVKITRDPSRKGGSLGLASLLLDKYDKTTSSSIKQIDVYNSTLSNNVEVAPSTSTEPSIVISGVCMCMCVYLSVMFNYVS
jgi:hypothetical protein